MNGRLLGWVVLGGVLGFVTTVFASIGVEFTPTGEVTVVSQAVANFSQPVVALGDVEQPSPFDVFCSSVLT